MRPVDRNLPDLSVLLGQEEELDRIGAHILNGGPRAVRYRETRPGGASMVFVAHHDDVVTVLTDEAAFSLRHYGSLYSAIAPRGAYIIMRDEGPERAERMDILNAAAARTPWFGPDRAKCRDLTRACVDNVITAVKGRHVFDLIEEYGFFVPYLVAKRVLGLGEPRAVSLLPLAICLLNGHSPFQILKPETRPYLTDVVWSELVVGQILQNFENRVWPLRLLARSSVARLRSQFGHYIDAFPRTAGDQTLLNALWAVRDEFSVVKDRDYREHVISIMAELVTTLLLVPGSGFTGIVDRWLSPGGPGFEASLHTIGTIDDEEFVQEQLRLAPPDKQLLRTATRRIDLGGLTVEPGEYVCVLVKWAGADIPDPDAMKGGRCPSTYLHFGPENGPHRCFGHRLAPTVLAEMFQGLRRLPQFDCSDKIKAVGGSVPGRLPVTFRQPARLAP